MTTRLKSALAILGLTLLTATTTQAGVLYGGVGRGSVVNAGAVITVDQTNGSGTLVGNPSSPGGLTGITFDSLGQLWGSTIDGPAGGRVSDIAQINPDTGALISSAAITRSSDGAVISIGDLAYQSSTGTIFGIGSNSATVSTGGELFTIDTGTGLATLVGNTMQSRGGGIAFAPNGTLYFLEFNELHTLDALTGGVLTTVNLSTPIGEGLAVRSDGTLFGTAPGSMGDGIFTIDPLTGLVTTVGTTGIGATSDLAFRPMAVAEPGTLAIFGLGLLGLGLASRKRTI